MLEIEAADPGTIDGIGFQSHLTGYPVSPPRLQEIFDRYADHFPLARLKVTEYDLLNFPPSVEERYTEDFLTVTFAHPRMDGFLMWGFWDGKHWRNSAPLFDLDWNLKPAGQGFINKVFNDWWTETTVTTDADGRGSARVFKGDYEVGIDCDGELIFYDVAVHDDRSIAISCEGLVGNAEARASRPLRFAPNPAGDVLSIDYPTGLTAGTVRLHDATGRLVGRWTDLPRSLRIAALPPGSYVLSVRTDRTLYRERLEIVR